MPVVKIFKGIFTIKLKMISMFFFSVIFTNKIKAKLYAPVNFYTVQVTSVLTYMRDNRQHKLAEAGSVSE